MADSRDVEIAELRPTQMTLGLAEVKRRARQMAELSGKDLARLLDGKRVPYVLGPKRRLFIIDHHHLCRALLRIDHRTVLLGERKADWSDLDEAPFWEKMEAAGYCWPIDAEGNRRPYAKIPERIADLTDNPWRTLARGVRGTAFSNEDTPFQEFMWGDYFRSFMTRRLIETDLDIAEDLAVRLARLDEAQDLPGYLGG